MSRAIWRRVGFYAVLALLGVGTAISGQPFWVQVAIGIYISSILALSWDILARAGPVSLGQAAFFGIGAYVSAILAPSLGMLLAWAAGIAACAVVALLFGLVTLRLQGMYFTMSSVGFTLSLQVLALILRDWTGGAGGISPPPLAAGDHNAQLVYITGFLLLAAACSDLFLSSRFRPAFFMIRSNPDLAAASGVPVVGSKILAFMVSGSLAGLAGEAYGALYGYVVPTDVLILNWSIVPIASAILGGCDSTVGPVLGAVAMRGVEEIARTTIGGVGYQVVYGVVIIVCIVLAPTGLIGIGKAALERYFRRVKNAAARPASEESHGEIRRSESAG